MTELNIITARAEKTDALTLEAVEETLKNEYPDFKITNIVELDNQWEATLEKPLKRVSSRTRTSEFPPKGKEVEEETEEVEEEPEEEEGEEEESEEKEEPEGKEEGLDFDKKKEPKKDIRGLLKEILNIVKSLEDKAGLVDEFHQKATPHVEESGPSLGEMGPTAPGGGNPMGEEDMTPPKRPPIPRRPYVPSGKPDARVRNPAQRGMPSQFGNTKTVFASMTDGNNLFSLEDALRVIKEKYPEFSVVTIREDLPNNRYVGKLRRR